MATRHHLECADMILRELKGDQRPFGGAVFVVMGDYYQTTPVLRGKSRAEVVKQIAAASPLWKSMTVLPLEVNKRLNEGEAEYAAWLEKVGDGSANIPGTMRIELDSALVVSNIEELLEFVFGDFSQELSADQAVLCATNKAVDTVNDMVLDRLTGFERTYFSETEVIGQGDAIEGVFKEICTPEYLSTLNPSSLQPHKLRIKEGCIIFLIRNLTLNGGLCNGTKLRVVKMYDNCLLCEGLSGRLKGVQVFIPRVTLATDEFKLGQLLTRHQFPVRVCHAKTVNKSQGQSLKKVGVYLLSPVFSHGQLYVAASRVPGKNSIRFCVIDAMFQGTHEGVTYTVNEVYEEIIEMAA